MALNINNNNTMRLKILMWLNNLVKTKTERIEQSTTELAHHILLSKIKGLEKDIADKDKKINELMDIAQKQKVLLEKIHNKPRDSKGRYISKNK